MSYASEQSVLNAQWNAAEAQFQAACAAMKPHVLMRPLVQADGNMWCCLYGPDLQVGVAGFGKTPAEACAAFDKAWNEQSAPQMVDAENEADADELRRLRLFASEVLLSGNDPKSAGRRRGILIALDGSDYLAWSDGLADARRRVARRTSEGQPQ